MAETKKADIHMPLYIGDYLADTRELMAEEHGAYLLLLMAAWRRGGKLPKDPVFLQRMACVPARRWRHVWGMISRFFTEEGDSLIQGRLMRTLEEVKRAVNGASRAGLASAESRRFANGSAQPKPAKTHDGDPNGVRDSVRNENGTDAERPPEESDPKSESDPKTDPDPPSEGVPPVWQLSEADPNKTWTAWDWYTAFGRAWCPKYNRLAYGRGSPGDIKATGALEDILRTLEGEAARAQAAAPAMFEAYLALDGDVAKAQHPWSWFVGRFNAILTTALLQEDEVAQRRSAKSVKGSDGPAFWNDPGRRLGPPADVSASLASLRARLRSDGAQGSESQEPKSEPSAS